MSVSFTDRFLREEDRGFSQHLDRPGRRREQRHKARTAPPTVRDQALARLKLELNYTRPEPYNPWKQPITPQQAAANRRVLELALKAA
ncbi:hypothetical protein AB0N60_38375 [Streptomyces microflavus]|uniref:Uncharacterized protein n=1 Tax=Streptomyces microflavus DSM 40593 TaxID=1303692 RepID=N0CJE4_STRMI|nr:hypothetical protein [Streptomyces microflavus]AGK75104.1 hypothetical protein SFUL_119 [Streptomyces microflavus DSM 40593]